MTRADRAAARSGRRIRRRLALTVTAVVAITSLALSLLAYVAVSRSLRSEVLDRAVEEARFNVGVLATERLLETVRPGDIESSGLAADFQRRDIDVYVDLGAGPGDDFVSGLDVVNAPEVVSAELQALVAGGSVAAERVAINEVPHLIVAARRPPAGPDFYFFTDVSDTENALAQLARVLVGASLLLVLLGALAGWRGGRLAASLADTVAELTAARTRERRFVADVSHELRTPVTALVHEADELSAQVEQLPAGSRRVVELLDDDVRRLRDLVEELLELSRLDATETPGTSVATAEVELWDVDVARFLDAVVARRLPEATVHAPPGCTVRTDRRRLERIVGNLVDNARTHAEGAEVTVTAWLDGSLLHVEVADTGPGVPGDELERIFDRFTKADTSRGSGGSGLGLAIVREHARVLGASVTARNRDEGGLAVELRLPVQVVTDL
ncbi:MAG: HAMP domain-containing histidine kinase [Actinobacteria bacterium]|jgi:two-component system sensor histidine kinase MtrB|nr:HAMP domain-containing histidine kinase [Actinomycetota bacterium]